MKWQDDLFLDAFWNEENRTISIAGSVEGLRYLAEHILKVVEGGNKSAYIHIDGLDTVQNV